MITHHSVQTLMIFVLLALVPALFVKIWAFGYLPLISLLSLFLWSLFLEYLYALLIKNKSYLLDTSYLVSAFILFLALPPEAGIVPLIVGITFGLIFGKFIFGGTGLNLFNPAMLAYIFILLNFPTITYQSHTPFLADSLSSPTILSSQSATISNTYYYSLHLAYLVGGLALLALKVIHLRVPAFVFLGVIATYLVINIFTPQSLSILLYGGSFVFLAFFIATDPISLPQNYTAQMVLSFIVGGVAVGIRMLSSKYPDGMAFAIIFGNCLAPMIDYLCKKK